MQKLIKRFFDIESSIIALVLFSPIFLIIALMIKLEDKGNVFYRANRIGEEGKPFKMYKFRTMVSNADKIGGPSTANDDPRITRTGRILRKLKLDEIPQFFNVLSGQMSIVGPRPEVAHYVNMFTQDEMKILSVKPGITDWASLWNSDEGGILAGSVDPEKTYLEKIRPEKIRLQLQYVNGHSFWVDMKIILFTALKLLKR